MPPKPLTAEEIIQRCVHIYSSVRPLTGRTRVSRTLRVVVSIALLCALFVTASAQEQVTVQALLSDGKKYDGKQVVLVGVVRDLRERISKKGNPYYIFKIGEGKQTVSVFSYGKATVKNGDKVRVTGKFAVEKRVAYATYRNEIDVSKGKVELLTSAPAEKEKASSGDKK